MNRAVATAHVKETKIVYVYVYMGERFEIEHPKTEFNDMVREGDIVDILMGVSPHVEFKPEDVIEPL